jgi:AraC-like DNA-binding protein
MFVAEGYFDPLDHSYVPGTITLEYVRGGEKVSFDREIDYDSPEAIDALPQLWKDADIDIITNTETEVALDITAGYGDDQVSFELSITRSEIPSYLTPATAESYGYTKMTDDYGRDMYIRSHGGGGKSLVPQFSVIDFLGDEASDYCIDQIKDAFGEAFEAAGKSGNVFWSALGIAFTLQDGIGTYKDIKELQKVAASNPALTAEEKQMYLASALVRLLVLCKLDTGGTVRQNINISPEVRATVEAIDQDYAKPLTVAELARRLHVSPSTLSHKFSRELNISLYRYLSKKRLAAAHERILAGETMTEAAAKSGFSNYSCFFRMYRKYYGGDRH